MTKKKKPGSYWAKKREENLRAGVGRLSVKLKAAEARAARLEHALLKLGSYAGRLQPAVNGIDVKIGGVQVGTLLAAIRDYSREARSTDHERYRRGESSRVLVSAKDRWGIDFEEASSIWA